MGKKGEKETNSIDASIVGKILKTTDGYFNGRADIKKPRTVAVVEQRKDDKAVAVVKIYSKEGKEEKIGKTFIPDLVLKPEEHPALREESVVGRQVHFGVKRTDESGKAFHQPILSNDLQATDDSLTKKELKQVRKEVHNTEPKHRKSYKKKKKSWKKHFKK